MNAIVETSAAGAIAVQPTQFSGPMASAIAALQAGMTIEQMQGLMGLQKDWESNEARKSYVADMAEFKRNPPEIYKTKQVAFSGTSYSHATLGDVAKAVVEALARHGFSHSWETKQVNGLITVTCKITHRLGHSESTTMESTADNSGKKNAIQQVASSVTYLSRYTLLAACGLATMDLPDDDGHGSSQAPVDYDQRSAVETWMARADAAINIEALRVTRSLAAEEFTAAGDVIGWNAVKVHCANAKAKLEGVSK
jgi:hypothetical protein